MTTKRALSLARETRTLLPLLCAGQCLLVLALLLTLGVALSTIVLAAALAAACLPWLLLLPLALGSLRRFPLEPGRSSPGWIPHLALALLLAGLHLLLALLILRVAGPLGARFESGYWWIAAPGMLLFDMLVYGALLARDTWQRLGRQMREREQDAERLNRHLSEARLQTLKMQLNPHFLFNTLNGISVLVEKGAGEQALGMIGELSAFLRRTLNSGAEKWVSLGQELEMIRGYLAIEQLRFGERLQYHEDCEPLALTAKLPPMLLQPLFENALVHGLAEKAGPCRLHFECRVVDRRLAILLSDNGRGFDTAADPGHQAGIGLSNIRARLREIYGEDHVFALERHPAGGTLVKLRIPVYKESLPRGVPA